MSQQLLRPLRSLPWLHHHRSASSTLPLYHHLLTYKQPTESPPTSPTPTPTPTHTHAHPPHASSPHRNLHTRSRGLRIANVPLPSSSSASASGSDSDSEQRKSRNQLKREARRSVQWGMDLASFTPPQIKRILRVVSLDQVVFEALMLVKRLGPDVREGKRRQFNYIGKLLRDVEPELMDRLIRATKDSDQKELQALTGLGADDLEDDDELIETESEEDEKEPNWYDIQVTRWFDGLIDKDIEITNEVYSVQGVEFDRQELRKLVRRVHSAQEMKAENDEEERKVEIATIGAKKALTHFLRGLAKRLPNEY